MAMASENPHSNGFSAGLLRTGLLVQRFEVALESLKDVPEHQRRQMVAGMRWTLWLSAASVPFSYGVTILLARVSPEAIGTYGLLNVYIGLVLGLFYLGGDAVAIKFIPELDKEKRLSFLVSYFLVICLAVFPWVAAAAIWPQKLRYLMGEQNSESFQILLLILSPVSILASLVGAALKGMLEIGWAQIIARLITIGSFLIYATLSVTSHELLVHFYSHVIWGTYLILCALSAFLGIQRLSSSNALPGNWQSLKFFLPRGFWHYTLSLQQLSALGFFTQRLDAIVILNFGDLALLGRYVAVITLAESTRLISRFFTDTLLPSLTNMVAARNLVAASGVFQTHMRVLFLVNTVSTCGLILMARPITALLGARYMDLSPLVILLAFFVGLSIPSSVGGTVLSSIGKQQRAVGVALAQIALYIILFLFLWPRWQLMGAVSAYGLACFVSGLMYFAVAKHCSPFNLSISREYAVFGVIAAAATFFARTREISLVAGLFAWAGAIGFFALLAQYSPKECKQLIQFFSPVSFISDP